MQPLQSPTIVSRSRLFERVYPKDGTIHYFQLVRVLDRYVEQGIGPEGRVPITHESEVEVDPPENPLSY